MNSPYDNNINFEVYKQIKPKTKCLDVGCWSGNLGKKLIKDKNCTVDGIDNNINKLKEAKKNGYRNIYNIDLNTFPTRKFKTETKYDYIICADILEHLINSSEFLIRIKTNLKKNGIIIISLPNIAFVLQRILLLFGKFNYSEKGGIMDNTHLKFFTQDSIEKLVSQSGLRINKIYGYSQVKNRFFFLRYLAKFLPRLFAIQFIVLAERK